MREPAPTVFVVDDDESVRKSITRLLSSVGLNNKSFSSAVEFLDRGPSHGPACLLLDIRMPGMSGLDLQKELAKRNIVLSIVFITGHGSIPLSVQAMKAGAVDFLEKPFDEQTLLDAISQAIEKDRKTKLELADLEAIQHGIESLTPREREVFDYVVKGMLNKQIAFELKTSERTIKAHRAQVMKKMKADSLADLVRMHEKTKS